MAYGSFIVGQASRLAGEGLLKKYRAYKKKKKAKEAEERKKKAEKAADTYQPSKGKPNKPKKKDKSPSFKKTEGAIAKRNQRMREEMPK